MAMFHFKQKASLGIPWSLYILWELLTVHFLASQVDLHLRNLYRLGGRANLDDICGTHFLYFASCEIMKSIFSQFMSFGWSSIEGNERTNHNTVRRLRIPSSIVFAFLSISVQR